MSAVVESIALSETGEMDRRPPESLGRTAWRSLRRNPVGLFGLIGFSLLIVVSLLAPVIAPVKPTEMDFNFLLSPPNATHPFGTDELGRDILSRVIWGGRESLSVSLLSIVIAGLGGVTLGLISGYSGGLVDSIIMRLVDVTLAFPHILLVLSIVSILGPGLTTVLIALGLSYIPPVSRFVRGTVLAVKHNEYITAARVIGGTPAYIMLTQILPNIMAPLIIYSTMGLGGAILTTAGLSYLGLGAQPPSPEWGAMLNAGREYLREAWWMSIWPGATVFLAVLCINLLGDALRDALDPKLRV